jgi:Fe-S cluster biogenesis protein NfuA
VVGRPTAVAALANDGTGPAIAMDGGDGMVIAVNSASILQYDRIDVIRYSTEN